MSLIEIEKSITIEASANQAWEQLGPQFAGVSTWATAVTSAVAVVDGTKLNDAPVHGRVCEVPGFGTTDEVITQYDSTKRVLAYSVESEKIPGFVQGFENTYVIRELGTDRSEVTSSITADATGIMGKLMGGMMKKKFAKTISTVLVDFKDYVETGQPSKGKVAAVVKASA